MIKRAPRRDRYTVIDNSVLEDERLDWKELGLLCYLLSLPDNWEVSPTHLAKQRKTGRDGIYSALKKMQECGYAARKPNPKGGWDWTITENPNTDFPTQTNTKASTSTNSSKTNTKKAAKGKTQKPKVQPQQAAAESEFLELSDFEKQAMQFVQESNDGFWRELVTDIEQLRRYLQSDSPKGLKAQVNNWLSKGKSNANPTNIPVNSKTTSQYADIPGFQ